MELEENLESTIYDDYKFVTRKTLVNLGKDHGEPRLPMKRQIRQKIKELRAQRDQLKDISGGATPTGGEIRDAKPQ
ncbi:nucleolar protein 10-like [Chanodichthys erythropterus]|uniref:nucleolar protein 10-like n=1 Tax=Chanodichthys erythropterus TaxID=933992 RepID=UPI00351E77C3